MAAGERPSDVLVGLERGEDEDPGALKTWRWRRGHRSRRGRRWPPRPPRCPRRSRSGSGRWPAEVNAEAVDHVRGVTSLAGVMTNASGPGPPRPDAWQGECGHPGRGGVDARSISAPPSDDRARPLPRKTSPRAPDSLRIQRRGPGRPRRRQDRVRAATTAPVCGVGRGSSEWGIPASVAPESSRGRPLVQRPGRADQGKSAFGGTGRPGDRRARSWGAVGALGVPPVGAGAGARCGVSRTYGFSATR